MRAIERAPVVGSAGIKRGINGPMIWSPDSSALFGPTPELCNYFCCCGVNPGFSQSGDLGLLSAEWMVEGEPRLDMFGWDLARYGAWADKAFTKARVRDQYANRFKIHFSNKERAAGRPVRVRPIYDTQKAMGAVFGLNYGWEHPLWFAAEGEPREETIGFERQNWWAPSGASADVARASGGHRHLELHPHPYHRTRRESLARRPDATGNEPIFDLSGAPAGKVSSGAFGYHVNQSLALAYLRLDIVAGTELEAMIIGRPHRARVLDGAAFDREGKRLRM